MKRLHTAIWILASVVVSAPSADAQCYPTEAETWADAITSNNLRWSETNGVGGSHHW